MVLLNVYYIIYVIKIVIWYLLSFMFLIFLLFIVVIFSLYKSKCVNGKEREFVSLVCMKKVVYKIEMKWYFKI